VPEHPNATRARDAYVALWERGDLQPTLDWVHDDVVWTNDIGAGPWAKEIRGKDRVLEMQGWWMEFFEGNFKHELIDVCASDDHVAEILREVGEKDGHVFDNRAVYLFELDDDGKVVNVRTLDMDRQNIEEFWAAVGQPAGVG
jgi:ketosteroid isomerase-like protein